ncbi:nitronate monooxygenase [Candidatus Acetothermia bacterium]|nr:nitronate monooxygenase [Candidatus Acetothermia bacterium]MBI3643651.1 nitronate monooxygenase [Candidatus Acetothermia bacterium]
MLRTPLCDLLGIEFPVIQAGMGLFTSAELVAAVSNAGGLGSLGASQRSAEDLRIELKRTKDLTFRPFAVNHLVTTLNEESFAITLEAKPYLISLALGDPGNLVNRAHDSGILVMHQVHTVQQAREAAERGVDVIIAQGSEAGGFGGSAVTTLTLVPQIVDAVKPIPVVAAGGIANGRGLVAALSLGAQGINIGTRFLASEEAPIHERWKQMIIEAESDDTLKVSVWNDIMPIPGRGGYGTVPRAINTPFIEKWHQNQAEAKREAERLQVEMMAAMQQGNFHEIVPFAGESVGMINDILPAKVIVHRIVMEAEETFEQVAKFLI